VSARLAILISTAVGYLVGGLVLLFLWPHVLVALTNDELAAVPALARVLIGGPIMLIIAWAIGVYASEKVGGDRPANWRHVATGAAIGFGSLAVLALVITIDFVDD
jgi:hypothetical protein